MANKPPWFKFWVREWRSSPRVRQMSLEMKGLYIEILAAMWDSDDCGLPRELPLLSNCTGTSLRLLRRLYRSMQHIVPPLFFEKNGRIYSERLVAEREHQQGISATNSDNAKAGWPRDSQSDRIHQKQAVAMPTEEEEDTDKSLPPYSPPKGGRHVWTEAQVEVIRLAYPRKAARPLSLQKIAKSLDLIAAGEHRPIDVQSWPPREPAVWLLDRVQVYASICPPRKSEAFQFVPQPSTWFHQARWADEEDEWKSRLQDPKAPEARRAKKAAGEYDEQIHIPIE